MSTDAAPLTERLLGRIVLAEDLDLLHLSLISLLEMNAAGEIEIFLDLPNKSAKQKTLYLEKVIGSLRSPLLQETLREPLKAGDFGFFGKNALHAFLSSLQQGAERFTVVKLTLAIKFKNPEIAAISELLAKKTGRPVALAITVDHSLIGGAVIQYGSYITDYSLKSRLERFRTSWHKAAIETPA